MIRSGDNIITEQAAVAEEMNNFYLNIANDIGDEPTAPKSSYSSTTPDFVASSEKHYSEHPCITNIENSEDRFPDFSLSAVDQTYVEDILKDLDPTKSTGFDQIPAKYYVMTAS